MEPSAPAFWAIARIGSSKARRTMSTPIFSSSEPLTLSSTCWQRISATPPPGTMPSSSAARVACSASSTRCFFSFISVSVAAPTFTTATPPASFASRSCSFSRSKSESVFSISCFSCLIRDLIASGSPAPSMIVVESLSTTTRRARPSCESFVFSSLSPISSVITSAPVRTAMSSSMRLRRSPKPGAFTATAVNVPRSLLTTIVADRLHPLGVGDHVGRQVALVELHALGELELEAECLPLLDVYDAVLADLVDRVGEHVADLPVARRHGRDAGDLLLTGDLLRLTLERLDDRLDSVLDAALQRHRVCAGGDVLQALADDRLRQHGRGRRAVACDVVRRRGDLAD